MPRKLTIECTCDRCGRVWYDDYTQGEEPPSTPQLSASFRTCPEDVPMEVKFDVLCASCAKTVGNLVESLGKLAKRSPAKSGATEEAPDEGAPPSEEKVVKRRGRPSSSGSSRAQST